MKKDKIGIGEEGMLWLSLDTKKSLIDRINEALEYFRTKYGEVPGIVYVNPKTLGNNNIKITGIRIVSDHRTLENNFYVFCKKRK